MPTFDIDPEEITVFPIEDEYWFSHYFDREDLFERLPEYYNDEAYRFEIRSRSSKSSRRSKRSSPGNTSSSWSPRTSTRTV